MRKIYPELLFEDWTDDQEKKIADSGMFSFPAGDGCLWGQIMTPGGSFEGPRPCVLFFHGFPGGNRNDDFAHALCRIGCVVLVLHHRGAWGSPGTYLVSGCIADIQQLAEYVRSETFVNRYHTDPECIYLFGHSMGGNNVINAGKELSWIRGMMLMAPYDSTCYIRKEKPEILRELIEDGAAYLNCHGPEALFDDIEKHIDDWDFAAASDALKDQNLLFLSGTHDDVAPEEDMVVPLWEKLENRKTNAVQRWFRYPAGHALMGCRVKALKDMVKFLEDTL